MTVGILFLLI